MLKSIGKSVLILIFGLFFLAGCSGGEEKKPAVEAVEEKGAIKEMTDEVAHEMVDKMNAPKDKARAATEMQEKQNQALEKASEVEE
ncbi:MAG: hypothetical protein OEV64_06285 [Desulfobulbaceae bacterium]|nr:hypothetical protein [Desulfobulbaceae bacterium]